MLKFNYDTGLCISTAVKHVVNICLEVLSVPLNLTDYILASCLLSAEKRVEVKCNKVAAIFLSIGVGLKERRKLIAQIRSPKF